MKNLCLKAASISVSEQEEKANKKIEAYESYPFSKWEKQIWESQDTAKKKIICDQVDKKKVRYILQGSYANNASSPHSILLLCTLYVQNKYSTAIVF